MTKIHVEPNPLRGAKDSTRAIAKSGAGAGPWVIGASIAGIAVAAGIVVYLLYKKPAPSCTCADGTPCPNNDPTQCKGGSGGTGGGTPFPTGISASPTSLDGADTVVQPRDFVVFEWICCGTTPTVTKGNTGPLIINIVGRDAAGNTVPLSGIPVSASTSIYASAQSADPNTNLQVTPTGYTDANGNVALSWGFDFSPTMNCNKGSYSTTSTIGYITVQVQGASLSVNVPVRITVNYYNGGVC